MTTTTSVMVDQPNQLSVHAASTVQTASSTSTPPPYPSTGSPHAPPMVRPSYSPVTVGQVPAYRPVTSPPVYARQVVNSGPRGVIRHPGVHPNSSSSQSVIQVKPSSGAAPPPPPLVSNPRVPQKALRPQGLYVPPQSSSSTSASRARPPLPSHPTSYGPLQVRTGVINHRPQGNVPPPLSSAAVAPNTHTQAGTGEKTPSQPGAPHTQRPIIPNYHGIPRSMNLPRNSAPLSFCNVRTSIAGGFGRQLPPQIRPQGTSPGPLQQVRVFFLFHFFPQSMYYPHLVLHGMKRMSLNYRITPAVDLIHCRYWKLVRQNATHTSFVRAMIPANFVIRVRTPKCLSVVNYSGISRKWSRTCRGLSVIGGPT